VSYEIRNPEIEALLKELAVKIDSYMPDKYGFTLMIFGYDNQDFFYISSADRNDMVKTMQEFIERNKEV
jgi:hypothetical protein